MIAILDASSFFFACLAMAILIGSGKNGILSGDRKFVVGGLILFMGIYYFCIFAKWANISKSLEIFEDFEGSLIPMWWAFVFYALINMVTTNELKESEGKYRLIVENQSEVIIKMDQDQCIRFASPSFCRLMGKTEKELVDNPLFSIQDQAGKTLLPREALSETIDPSRPSYFEKTIHTPEGKKLLAWHLSALTKETNGQDVLIAVGRDITERRKAEESLAKIDRQYKQLMENLPVAVFRASFDGDGRILMVNKAGATMLGYESEKELLLAPIAKLLSDQNAQREIVRQVRSKGVVLGHEASLVKKDGSQLIGSITMNLLTDERDNAIYVDGIIEDITSIKQALDALATSEKLHRQAQKIAKVGHWEQDISKMTYKCSEGLTDIINVPKGTVIDLDFVKRLIHPEDLRVVLKQFRKSVESHAEYDLTHRYLLADGEVKYIHSRCIHVYDPKGNHIKSIGTIQDVTALKVLEFEKHNTERQLRQAQKLEAIGTLAGGIAHDFNNILTPILGFSQMLAESLPEKTRNQESAEAIYQAALRAADLVSHILAFSRKADAERMPVHVPSILKEAIKFVRASIPSTITIHQDIQTNCLPVLADPTQIHQIIMNLCTNAYFAMQETGGDLSISLKQDKYPDPNQNSENKGQEGEYFLYLKVQDTGQGMDKKTLERIFDPYFTTKKQGEGTGLGLSTVIGILNSIRGRITVDSEPGKGAVFHVYLPCMDKLPSAAHPSSSSLPMGNGENILIVDDEGTVAAMLAQMLKKLGYNPFTATESPEALKAIQADPDKFALVISDLTMPTLTGVELARNVAEFKPDLPFVLSSGMGDNARKKSAGVPNIRSYLQKPVTRTILGQIVQQILDKEQKAH